MQQDYSTKLRVLSYIEEIWFPWKTHFVRAWIDCHFHFGTTVTSRIESAHAALKQYLEVHTNML